MLDSKLLQAFFEVIENAKSFIMILMQYVAGAGFQTASGTKSLLASWGAFYILVTLLCRLRMVKCTVFVTNLNIAKPKDVSRNFWHIFKSFWFLLLPCHVWSMSDCLSEVEPADSIRFPVFWTTTFAGTWAYWYVIFKESSWSPIRML